MGSGAGQPALRASQPALRAGVWAASSRTMHVDQVKWRVHMPTDRGAAGYALAHHP